MRRCPVESLAKHEYWWAIHDKSGLKGAPVLVFHFRNGDVRDLFRSSLSGLAPMTPEMCCLFPHDFIYTRRIGVQENFDDTLDVVITPLLRYAIRIAAGSNSAQLALDEGQE